jgi:hypothetical protein
MWDQIPTFDGLNLLIGNQYFPPDTKPEIIVNNFRFSENKLDTHNFRVIMAGNFNAPGFDWKRGLPLPNSHHYLNLREMEPTPARVFLTVATALILSAAVICLI